MERAEWLKKVRAQGEASYDRLAPASGVKVGLYANATHRQFIEKFLGRLSAGSAILDAACGAGRYDGMLLEAGHRVLGIDQSGNMLARAREFYPQERFPALRYAKMGLQEMDFEVEFDGAICMDALEHIFPEDWPGVLARFQRALRPGGVLYFTVEMADPGEVSAAYERAKALGLPVVLGEVAEEIDAAEAQVGERDAPAPSGEQAGLAVYHYYPSSEQVRAWLDEAGLRIEEEGTGDEYVHVIARRGKKS